MKLCIDGKTYHILSPNGFYDIAKYFTYVQLISYDELELADKNGVYLIAKESK